MDRLYSFLQSQEEVAAEEVEEEEEAVVVLEAEDRWEWEVFSKEVCQNYGQLEVKIFLKEQQQLCRLCIFSSLLIVCV